MPVNVDVVEFNSGFHACVPNITEKLDFSLTCQTKYKATMSQAMSSCFQILFTMTWYKGNTEKLC